MKKEFKITASQIMKTHKSTSVKNQGELESWFPELFETKLVNGGWYKSKRLTNFLIRITDAESGLAYGFCDKKNWNENGSWCGMGNLIEATDEEVEDALIEEAINRGYTDENTIDLREPTYGNSEHITGSFHYYKHRNILYSASQGEGGKMLFKDGKWANKRNRDLKIGAWYRHDIKGLLVYNEGFSTYGFWQGNYSDTLFFDRDGSISKRCVEATEEEVEEALIMEAANRGYKTGTRIDFIAGKCTLNHMDPYLKNGHLWYGDCRVFVDGEWAEIINETITREEAEIILNKTIV